MSFYPLRFNLYLLLVVAAICSSCKTDSESKAKNKSIATFRLFVENRAVAAGNTRTVNVLREHPVEVSIGFEPVLTEANIVAARLLETPGGYAIEMKFDQSGILILEQNTAANPGRHLVIFSQWGKTAKEGRWLASPIETRRIPNGILSFTPDASREEAEKVVLGLNNVAKLNAKGTGK